MTAFNSPPNELKLCPIRAPLEFQYGSCCLLLYRPFLQYVIEYLQSSEAVDVNSIAPHILSRTHKAIQASHKLVSLSRTRTSTDWFTLKKIIETSLLVVAASRVLPADAISTDEMHDTLNGATEIFARAAKGSESA